MADQSDHDMLVEMRVDMKHIKNSIAGFPDRYVTKEEFTPVQKIVYGLSGGVLMAFLAAIVALVLQK